MSEQEERLESRTSAAHPSGSRTTRPHACLGARLYISCCEANPSTRALSRPRCTAGSPLAGSRNPSASSPRLYVSLANTFFRAAPDG
jgi:hypothetical protein